MDLHALVFDVQGTVVDFFAPLMRMGQDVDAEKGLALDWSAISDRWRALYRERMDAVIGGREPWVAVDAIYRDALDRILDEAGVGDRFTPAERDAMNGVWTRLEPWPDTLAGLARLRRRYITATLSNATMAALVRVVRHAALPFDAVLSAQLARSYKPSPAVYQLAVDYLGVPASSIMLVACHKYDLRAAAALGMRTAFVARPLEFGPDGKPDVTPDAAFDVNARDLLDLADQLGA